MFIYIRLGPKVLVMVGASVWLHLFQEGQGPASFYYNTYQLTFLELGR